MPIRLATRRATSQTAVAAVVPHPRLRPLMPARLRSSLWPQVAGWAGCWFLRLLAACTCWAAGTAPSFHTPTAPVAMAVLPTAILPSAVLPMASRGRARGDQG